MSLAGQAENRALWNPGSGCALTRDTTGQVWPWEPLSWLACTRRDRFQDVGKKWKQQTASLQEDQQLYYLSDKYSKY